VLLAGLGAAASGPQTPPPAPPTPPQDPQRPIFRIEANFVRVDVFPSADGVPVQDLTADDFEVLEDGVPQPIETFEHVVIRPAPLERVDPGSGRRMLEEAADARNRVFVIFLDEPNVGPSGSHNIAEPLVRLMDQILGPDDLVGFMTPGMSAAELTLGRKAQVFEEGLRGNWAWGMRDSLMPDETEQHYEDCYPPLPVAEAGLLRSRLASEMIARKRERATLEALQDLVWHLGAIREERKAILAVTEGWLLYTPDPGLTSPREDPELGREAPPGIDPIGVGPGGKLTRGDPKNSVGGLLKSDCDTDRMQLAYIDDQQFFRDILADANRNNASFYPIDPRGIAVWDSPLGPERPPTPEQDYANLRERLDSLHELAINTDGIAVVSSNDLDVGMRKIAADLTSYYLLGYYSTNTKLDGRFREITVRVKRPGVDVRARRGYRAATEEEIAAGRAAAEPPDPGAEAVEAALGALARIRSDTPFRINVLAGPAAGSGGVWVAGEIDAAAVRARGFAGGGTVDLVASGGGASGSARVSLGPGERAFLTWLDVTDIGDRLDVRARLAPAEGSALPLTDAVRVGTGAGASRALLFRRGPTTGNRVQPAADLRFSRSERLHLELPVGPDVKPGTGRVLDRAGQPLVPPVEVGTRLDEATGQRWITADVTLAPLGAGDFVIEVTVVDAGTAERVLTAIRVTR